MDIQWFPGHMAKTRRILQENLKLVDVVIELIDARVPKSSKNPEINKIIGSKRRVLVLNKADLADEKLTGEWMEWYRSQGYSCVAVDSLKGAGIRQLIRQIESLMADKLERERTKGKRISPIKAMVAGIPNVGKSSLINRVAGRASAATGNRPGITRGKQWIRLGDRIILLDTPGVLQPKFQDQEAGLNLAFAGAIKDEILDVPRLAAELLKRLSLSYPKYLAERFKIEGAGDLSGEELLYSAGRIRGCIMAGGEVDLQRIAAMVLDEFRKGKIGRITLETPDMARGSPGGREDGF